MQKSRFGNIVIIGLAILGAMVILPQLLGVAVFSVWFILRLIGWMFAGALAGRILRGEGYGPIADIALGIIGGIVGTLLFSLIGLGWMAEATLLSILVGAVGAVIFVYLVRLINSDFAR
jgi:uncharacterized membrane protein YeaQ/YmgE (transglycosylase-associated protein family)